MADFPGWSGEWWGLLEGKSSSHRIWKDLVRMHGYDNATDYGVMPYDDGVKQLFLWASTQRRERFNRPAHTRESEGNPSLFLTPCVSAPVRRRHACYWLVSATTHWRYRFLDMNIIKKVLQLLTKCRLTDDCQWASQIALRRSESEWWRKREDMWLSKHALKKCKIMCMREKWKAVEQMESCGTVVLYERLRMEFWAWMSANTGGDNKRINW